MLWALLSTAFLQGILGSTHCIGMCGPFVAILQTREGSGFFSNLSYNLGRTLSYTTVGAILGSVGWGANRYFYTEIASLVGGILIVLIGIGYIFPFFPNGLRRTAPSWLVTGIGRGLKNIRSTWALSILLGLASGLLPCGLLIPAYGLALLSGDPWIGSLTMISFSLGTYPMLMTMGLFGRKVLDYLQNFKTRILVGIVLILFGLFTILNRSNLPEEDPNCHTESYHFLTETDRNPV